MFLHVCELSCSLNPKCMYVRRMWCVVWNNRLGKHDQGTLSEGLVNNATYIATKLHQIRADIYLLSHLYNNTGVGQNDDVRLYV